jgi:hypothetical protein
MLWIAILTGAGLAATWTVEQDGSGDYEDIATAIAAAASGDSILVGPGFYEGVVDFGGKDLQVVSTDGPELTTIDGDGAGVYAVVFDSGESAAALLEGFTIDNTTRYAAIKVDASDPVLSDLVIRGFRAQGTSAVWVEDAGPTLTGIVFDDNESDDDGGHLHIERPLSMLIEDSSFTGGLADGYGGGFYVYGDCAAANDLTVTGSSSPAVLAQVQVTRPLRRGSFISGRVAHRAGWAGSSCGPPPGRSRPRGGAGWLCPQAWRGRTRG